MYSQGEQPPPPADHTSEPPPPDHQQSPGADSVEEAEYTVVDDDK